MSSNLFGWQDRPKDVERVMQSIPIPLFSYIYEPLKDSGKGKVILLYKFVEKLTGKFPVFTQAIGDCFNGSALVMMSDGTEKQIKDIVVGEKVITPFGNVKNVINTIKKPYDGNMIKIFSGFGRTLECTPDHLLMKYDSGNFEWVASDNITVNNTLSINRISNTEEVYDITYTNPESDYVYCLEIEDDHSFICNGYCVHNCVSMGTAQAVNLLKATEIVLSGEFEEWIASTSTEDIYGGSRIQIGNGQLGYGDGSIGAYAAEYVNKYGTLIRKKYGDIDLTIYSGQRAREWGSPRKGTPEILLPYAKEHIVKTITQVRTYEEARDAICNGYPVTVCSNYGFSSTRDSDGFASSQGTWPHCMVFGGADDGFKRPGLLCINSWGKWNSGPTRHEQPEGSFWIDASICNRMLGANDSWAFSNFDGFKPQELNLRIV